MQTSERKKLRRKQENFLFVLMGLILLGLFVSGYFLFVEKILPGISSTTGKLSQNADKPGDFESEPGKKSRASKSGEVVIPNFPEEQEITLYFGAKGKNALVKEIKKIPPEKMIFNLAANIVRELIKGPTLENEARCLIPPETQLRSLFYHQGTFFVDFSREFVENHPGGAMEEALTVFSIVSSLTELDKKAKVRFLVNGMEVETIKGHVSLKQIFSRNENILQGTEKGI